MGTVTDGTLAQQIVDTVHSVCGQPVNFIRPDGIILASTLPERIGTLHPAGRTAAQSGFPQEVFPGQAEGGSKPGLNLPVYHNGQIVAVIGITGDPDTVRGYAQLAERITLLLVREQELNEHNRTQADKRRYLMDALLHPGSGSDAYRDDLLQAFGVDTHTPKRMVLFRLQPGAEDSLTRLEAQAEELCRASGMRLYHYYYPDELAAVLDDAALPRAAGSLQAFARRQQGRCQIGIGSAVPLYELATSHETARSACRSAHRQEGYYALFDQLTWEPILTDLRPVTRRALLDKALAPLCDRDKALLRSYFAQDCSLQNTCAQLFLHKNTLQYRLNHIREQCGLDPRRFREGALLYLALLAEDSTAVH